MIVASCTELPRYSRHMRLLPHQETPRQAGAGASAGKPYVAALQDSRRDPTLVLFPDPLPCALDLHSNHLRPSAAVKAHVDGLTYSDTIPSVSPGVE